MNEVEVFSGPTLEAAKAEVEKWISQQRNIELTVPAGTQQTEEGRWVVSIHFQKTPGLKYSTRGEHPLPYANLTFRAKLQMLH